MIEVSIKKLKICFHFSFFATVSLILLLNENCIAIYSLYACILHEFGHLIAMIFTKQKVKSLIFYGIGIKIIKVTEEMFCPFSYDFIITIAGSITNFILFAFCSIFDNYDVLLFGYINLIIGLFNFLPIKSLDGGILLSLIIRRVCTIENFEKAEKFLNTINVILCLMVLIIFAIMRCTNFTVYLTIAYFIIVTLFM